MEMIDKFNIGKSIEERKRERAACISLIENQIKPRIAEITKVEKECGDILNEFLEENDLTMDEVIDYIDSDYTGHDLECLYDIYTKSIEAELLKEYYQSVIDYEDLKLWECDF